ncbi:unnamed protein product [Merluccius merluccius]
MAESGRKSLVWDIRKSLLTLSAGELYEVAKNVGPAAGPDQPELDAEDEEGCFEHISSFIQDESETPQQFLYRVIGLKQRVLYSQLK